MSLALILNPIFFPEFALFLAGLIGIIIGLFNNQSHLLTNKICLIGLIVSALCLYNLYQNQIYITYQFFTLNNPIILAKLIVVVSSIFVLLCFNNLEQNLAFELPVIVLFAVLGMYTLISSNDFITFYVGLELQSLSLYILTASNRNNPNSTEAGLKYFILGVITTGLILFGISLIYAYTASINFVHFVDLYHNNSINIGSVPIALIIGLVLILIGLLFKISAVPFHMWAPDVYEGSPTIFTMLIATAPKVAIIAIFIRIFLHDFSSLYHYFNPIILLVALLTLAVGSFAALKQAKLKRLLAYSAITNIGFILLGLLSHDKANMIIVTNYIIIYLSLTIASFAVLLAIENKNPHFTQISELASFSKSNPILAISFTICLLSLAGIPPFAGFFAKFYIIQSLIVQGSIWIAIVSVLFSVVASFYYLNIIKVMYFDDNSAPISADSMGTLQFVVILMAIFNSIYIFYYQNIMNLINSVY
ncbi:NADH-quinone oxidoreductase subunit N [Rickettsiales endosymbiont of Stachyamoeba lipophora]|uniref:NADH-quinone oxidoreductase subunit N n=1 Tax=Rickettsiales endosymbiont of Stachyamoeba lipophora TaxID=2486578 RepID=UPI000F646421|nr:NADH-quinone oxidoreductase subunit N [Rickettsiales endosymbiont of Stachyamoeba lipophora]AZL15995.1 NADH-quinone oxidoreductase subunit N [Rickettsiales endosymbiont of Stachyamoeba lipophora]